MNIKDEYIKFLKNYKTLFKKYIKKTDKLPFLDGELTDGFRNFKMNIGDEELIEEWLRIPEPESTPK